MVMKNLLEELKRIKNMMGIINEETQDKCDCGDGTSSTECCSCRCKNGTDSPKCCPSEKLKTLGLSQIPTDQSPESIKSLPKKEEITLDTTGVPQDLVDVMDEYGMTDPIERAHFLAQCKLESADWRATTEYASGSAYEGRCKDLGNCSPGDGVKYKGRGYIQLTGKSNYKEFDKWLKEKGYTDDVIKNPDLVATKFPAEVSAWFWNVLGPLNRKDFPRLAKKGSSLEIIDKIGTWINGGNPPNGYKQRRNNFFELIGKGNDYLASNK
jgi:putative chitinase